MKTFTCPSCGYDKLDVRPYKNMPDNPHPVTLKPPYCLHWGMGSYDVCACCGYEFGFDDDTGIPGNETSFQDYLKAWFVEGCQWFWNKDEHTKPTDWDLVKQLERAGIEVPDYIRVSRQLPGKTE